MSKSKVHKTKKLLDPLAPMMDNGERGGHLELAAWCGTTHRSLLPLLLDDDWRRVTCARCLRMKPAAPSMWQRILGWWSKRRAQ